MHFLPDVWVECDTCRGQRYNPETLAVTLPRPDRSPTCSTCRAARRSSCSRTSRRFAASCRRCATWASTTSRSARRAPTLSGGEAQRVKLAAELARPDTGRTLYLLDEPTTGLHFDDIAKLLDVLQSAGRSGQHGRRDRAQSRRHQDGRLGDRPGPGSGRRGRAGRRGGHAGGDRRECESGKAESGKPTATSLLRIHGRSPWRRCSPPGRSSSGSRTTPTPRRRADKTAISRSTKSADDAKMPWEADGRRWHTQRPRRPQRRAVPLGRPRFWTRSSDRIHELGEFSRDRIGTTARSSRSPRRRKSDGWFFHAITGETWLLKLKFRTPRHVRARRTARSGARLKPLNDLDDLPVYGNEPRVKCKNLRGPWQEVQIRRPLAGRDRHARVLDVPRTRRSPASSKFTEKAEREAAET